MLVQIAGTDVLGPFHLALVRLQFACDDVHKGGFSFTIGAYQSDMLSF